MNIIREQKFTIILKHNLGENSKRRETKKKNYRNVHIMRTH